MPDRAWRSARLEVRPFHEGIGHHHEIEAGFGAQQRAVISHTQHDIIAASGRIAEVSIDEIEFAEHQLSCGRIVRAALSSTELMYLWASVAPY